MLRVLVSKNRAFITIGEASVTINASFALINGLRIKTNYALVVKNALKAVKDTPLAQGFAAFVFSR
jgi:hypothetical protein